MAAALSFSSCVSTGSALRVDLSKAATRRTVQNGAVNVVALSPAVLESKSLGELRSLAREKGLRGDTKAELISLLSESGGSSQSNGSAYSNGAASVGAPAGATSAFDLRALQAMPMSQLRAVGRSKGVQGSTRDQIIKGLTAAAAPAAPAPSYAATPVAVESAPAAVPSYTPAAVNTSAPSGFSRQQLQSKALPTLKAIARTKGIANAAGLGKEQLIQALTSTASAVTSAAPPQPSPWVDSSPTPVAVAGATKVDDLLAMSLSQLRALGKEVGVRGDTKAELVGLLASLGPAATMAAQSTATAVRETLPPQSASPLPPFQSAVPASGSVALEPVRLATEVSALKQAMEDIEARDKAMVAERDSLIEQANFLRNVLVGGIGVAIVPLLLPFQIGTTSPSPSVTTATLSTPAPPVPVEPVTPPPPPAPIVKELSPEDYCRTLPSGLLSPQIAKFCDALVEPGF